MVLLRLIAAVVLVLNAGSLILLKGETYAGQEGRIFVSWEGFEADKCACVWMIKRFVDPKATIRFFPKGEPIAEGIPFDTPDSQLRRYHNVSAFEFMVSHFHLSDPKLVTLGRIIHDIEINIWDRKVMAETRAVQDAVNEIILRSKSSDEAAEECIRFFDGVYSHIE
jgi:hypothetical protein